MKKIIWAIIIIVIAAGVFVYWKNEKHDKIDFTRFAGVDYVTAKGNMAHYENTVLKVSFDFPVTWTYDVADSKNLSSRFESGRLFDAFAKDGKNSISLSVAEHSSVPLMNGNTGQAKTNLPAVSFGGMTIVPIQTSSNFNNNQVQYVTYTLIKNGYDYNLSIYGDIKQPFSAEMQGIVDSFSVGDLK